MARLRPQAYKVYRVGGAVRDALLGRVVDDHDYVVVGATPELMIASGYRPVGRDFPVFLHPETQDEYALARTERKHGRGYRGFEFFASPEVTLEDDLGRRDLTINAMALGDDGILIDPFGGQSDLAAGVLRHVSPAFAEDPLRVLRVARFAARFDFTVAPETEDLMRDIVASGELATLSAERVWQELAKGLGESKPSRLFATLRGCGALNELLPEVDALFGVARNRASHPEVDAGVHLVKALDRGAASGLGLAARYAVLAHDLDTGRAPAAAWTAGTGLANARRATALSERLRVPQDCADAACLTARWQGVVARVEELRPAACLRLLEAVDALRRPERLDVVLDAVAACATARSNAAGDYAPARLLRTALKVTKAVDAGKIARLLQEEAARRPTGTAALRVEQAIAKSVRAARLGALGAWRRGVAAR